MAKKDANGQALPPYLPFKTVQGFVQKLKETTVPERVDSSLLRTYSGSVARKLTVALRFLGLTEDGGRTTEALSRLVKAYGTPEWAVTLSEIISAAYRDIIGNLNIQIATPAQLEERFKTRGAEGSVLQACVGFYVAALKAAGVPLSPHIASKPRARAEKGRGRPRPVAHSDEAMPTSTVPASDVAGAVRFSFPIPGKAAVTMFLPADLQIEDWDMVNTMIRAYVERRKKA